MRKNDVARTSKHVSRRAKLHIEHLEPRVLLAVTASFVDSGGGFGWLRVFGDNAGNSIKVATSPTLVTVTNFNAPVNIPGPDPTPAQLIGLQVFGNDGGDFLDLISVTTASGFTVALNGNVHLSGDIGADFILGTGFGDQIIGGGGGDILEGNDGNDVIHGNIDNDTIVGGSGNDQLYGNEGNDKLYGEFTWLASVTSGNDSLVGGPGNDSLDGGALNDYLFGDDVDASWQPVEHATDGSDSLDGGVGDLSLSVIGGNDKLWGEGNKDTLRGRDGNDTLYGGGTGDYMSGDDGYDWMEGDVGDDTMYGGANNDSMFGHEGCDDMFGESGDDKMFGHFGDDYLLTGSGTDVWDGGTGWDTVDGVADADLPEGCTPLMLLGDEPEIEGQYIAFRDQRIDILFLDMLGRDDRRVYLRARNFTAAHIDVIERLIEEFLRDRG